MPIGPPTPCSAAPVAQAAQGEPLSPREEDDGAIAQRKAAPPPPVELEDQVTALFSAHGPYVYRVLRRLGVDEADVQDVCQEVFLVVHRKLAGFEGSASQKTWLYGICVRTASNYRRAAGRRRAHRERSAEVLGDATAPSGEAGVAARQALDRLLECLPDSQRETLVLYEIEQLTLAEVAEVLSLPPGTVASRLRAARQALRKAAIECGLCPEHGGGDG